MHAGSRWQFLADLHQRLAAAVGAAELEAATQPPDGVVRRMEPDRMWVGDRRLAAPIPRVVLDLSPPVPAADLWAAWGIAQPAARSGDQPDEAPWPVGRWGVRFHLVGAGEVGQVEVFARPVRVDRVDSVDPTARALLDAMSSFYPAWRGGWDVPPAAGFVVVHAEDRPVAGAAITHDEQGIAHASCLCVDPDRIAGPAGPALLDALEAVALASGCHRLCLDGSVFLHREHIPYLRCGYVVAPPYDGDADASVWAEKDLPAEGRGLPRRR